MINVSRFEIHHWIQVDFTSYFCALSSVRHGVVSRKWKCIFCRRREGEIYLPDSAWNADWSSGYDKYRLNNWWSEWKIWNLDWLNYYRVGKIANKFQFIQWAFAMRKILRAFSTSLAQEALSGSKTREASSHDYYIARHERSMKLMSFAVVEK